MYWDEVVDTMEEYIGDVAADRMEGLHDITDEKIKVFVLSVVNEIIDDLDGDICFENIINICKERLE